MASTVDLKISTGTSERWSRGLREGGAAQVPVGPLPWEQVFEDPSRPLAVDVGCGSGRFLLTLASRLPAFNLLGLDIRHKAGSPLLHLPQSALHSHVRTLPQSAPPYHPSKRERKQAHMRLRVFPFLLSLFPTAPGSGLRPKCNSTLTVGILGYSCRVVADAGHSADWHLAQCRHVSVRLSTETKGPAGMQG